MRLQSWAKQHSKLLLRVLGMLGIVFLVFGVPFLINFCYKKNASFSALATEWGAADVLSYYGSLLGAAATIFVLRQTIKFTNESQREERKLSIKPRLESKWKPYTDSAKPFAILGDGEDTFINLSADGTTSSDFIPEQIKTIISLEERISKANPSYPSDECLMDLVLLKGSKEALLDNNCLIKYDLFNYGAANAIDVKFLVNNELVCPRFCVPTDKHKRFILIIHESRMQDGHLPINISLQYADICSIGHYKQTEKFHINHANKQFITMQDFEDMLSAPTELRKTDKSDE